MHLIVACISPRCVHPRTSVLAAGLVVAYSAPRIVMTNYLHAIDLLAPGQSASRVAEYLGPQPSSPVQWPNPLHLCTLPAPRSAQPLCPSRRVCGALLSGPWCPRSCASPCAAMLRAPNARPPVDSLTHTAVPRLSVPAVVPRVEARSSQQAPGPMLSFWRKKKAPAVDALPASE